MDEAWLFPQIFIFYPQFSTPPASFPLFKLIWRTNYDMQGVGGGEEGCCMSTRGLIMTDTTPSLYNLRHGPDLHG